MKRNIKIGLVGVGMFGGDVHLRTYADLERSGISPWLGRIGFDHFAPELADVEFQLIALSSRTESSAIRAKNYYLSLTGNTVDYFHGRTPWVEMIDKYPDMDFLAVATPDHLHFEPTWHALKNDIHVVLEKPMTLQMTEADKIIELANERQLVVGLDMHKRYDPDHCKIFQDLVHQMGDPIYGRAVLEEPLEVATTTFTWASKSDPFSYVGVHWTDLFIHYLKTKPASLFAVGQKMKLLQQYDIDAYDAVQVSVVFDNKMHIQFVNNWITPADFEGPVNQESEILLTNGKVESDSQYRGLRYTLENGGSRTSNTHFTRDILRPDKSKSYVGYGKDSLIACVLAILRRKFYQIPLVELHSTFPSPEDGRLSVALIEAARIVRDANFSYLNQNLGTPVTAKFGSDGITILDPYTTNKLIYDRPI